MTSRQKRGAAALIGLLALALIAWWGAGPGGLWAGGDDDSAAASRAGQGGGGDARLVRAGVRAGSAPIDTVDCQQVDFLAELRAATKSGSPAYQRYVSDMFLASARYRSVGELVALFEAESDPTALAALGQSLCMVYDSTGDASVFDTMLGRLRGEADPALRAAIVRSLGGTTEPSSQVLREVADLSYADLARDPAPEVRAAVVENLRADIDASGGHDPVASANALEAAAGAVDADTQVALLESVSLERAEPAELERARALLDAGGHATRAAAARALGTAPPSRAEETVDELARRYRDEPHEGARRAILEAIARLRFAAAIPVLEKLRPVDPRLEGEIDAWGWALGRGWQLWPQIRRDKERYLAGQG